MSNQKGKKELSDSELGQAAGGADTPGGGGLRAESANSVGDPFIRIDVEANINDAPPIADPTIASGSGDVEQIMSEERMEP